jgi:hypothetical protein
MSTILESALDPARRAECQRHDAEQTSGELQRFVVRIGARTSPRLDFPVMGISRHSVEQQHMGLQQLGERFEVLTAEEAARTPCDSAAHTRPALDALPAAFSRSLGDGFERIFGGAAS